MKKILVLMIVIFISNSSISCSYKEKDVSTLLYKTFFKNIVRVSIIEVSSNRNEDIDNIDQLSIIRNEMKNIMIIQKYTANPNYGGIFKNKNFRLMHVFVKIAEKKHKVLELLYSTKDAMMIAREGDIFPDKSPKTFEEKISVYEFKIPQNVNTLIKQCENRLPKEGFYFNTWGENFN